MFRPSNNPFRFLIYCSFVILYQSRFNVDTCEVMILLKVKRISKIHSKFYQYDHFLVKCVFVSVQNILYKICPMIAYFSFYYISTESLHRTLNIVTTILCLEDFSYGIFYNYYISCIYHTRYYFILPNS